MKKNLLFLLIILSSFFYLFNIIEHKVFAAPIGTPDTCDGTGADFCTVQYQCPAGSQPDPNHSCGNVSGELCCMPNPPQPTPTPVPQCVTDGGFCGYDVTDCSSSGYAPYSNAEGCAVFCCVPKCNTGALPNGSCVAPNNTCNTGNGTQDMTYYFIGQQGSSFCSPQAAPPISCTTDNCDSGYTCYQNSCHLTYCTTGTTNCGTCSHSEPFNTCNLNGNQPGDQTCYHDQPAGCLNQVPFTNACLFSYNNCNAGAGYACTTNNNTCTTHIYVHVYVDFNHNGNLDWSYSAATVSLNGGNGQTTGSDGLVTYGGLTTGTYTVSFANNDANYETIGATSQQVDLTNNQGDVVVNFRVTPLYKISGNIFTDNNHNQNYDGGDSLFTNGTTIHITGPSAVNDMHQYDGTYSTPQNLLSGTYTVTQTETLPQGYTYTTPSSWTVTLGEKGSPGPQCSVSTSQDATCGDPNNGSITNLNFGIDPPYQISGNVFDDKNKDTHLNGSDTAYTNQPEIDITGPTPMTLTAQANGYYSTGQVLLPGVYRVTWKTPLPKGWFFTTPTSYLIRLGYNPPCSTGGSPDGTCGDPNTDSVNNLNFGATNENPWHQSACFDVRDDSGTYTNPIPAAPNCGGVSGAYDSLTNGDCSTGAGIIFTCNATPDFGLGSANTTNWQAGGVNAANQECFSGSGLNVIRTSYSYLETTAQQSGITPINMDTVCGSGGLSNCTLPANLAKGVYQANGDLHLNGYTFPYNATTPQGFIFLINGNFYIDGNLIVPAGSVAAFSTNGSIHVDKSVGQVVNSSSLSDGSVNNPNIEGLYSADNSFVIESYGSGTNVCNADGTPLDKKLNIVGSIVTNAAKTGGTFTDNRDLCIYDLSCPIISGGGSGNGGDGQFGDGGNGTGTGIGGDGTGGNPDGSAVSYLLTLFADGQFLNHQVFNWQELKP